MKRLEFLWTIVVRHFFYGVDTRGPEHALNESEPAEDLVHSSFLNECLHLIQHMVAVGEMVVELIVEINGRLSVIRNLVVWKRIIRDVHILELLTVDGQNLSYLVWGHRALLVRCAICTIAKEKEDVKRYLFFTPAPFGRLSLFVAYIYEQSGEYEHGSKIKN